MNSALGVAAALASAVLWAFSSPMLSAAVHRFGPSSINLYKSVVSALLFFATLAVVLGAGALGRSSAALPWFALSGLVGLAVGDTAYFVSLKYLGPATALILYQLSTVFGVALGVAFRGDRPGALQICGTLLVAGGVIYATLDRRTKTPSTAQENALSADLARRTHLRRTGIYGGLISALCQAVGLLVNQRAWDAAEAAGFARSDPANATLAATARMGATAAALVIAVSIMRRLGTETLSLRTREGWKLTFIPAVLGTYFGILTMQFAIANLSLGVASTLLATSPIFVIPAAWMMTGERPTAQKTIGALVATCGVALVSMRG